jgi:hypothetical protein
MVQTVEQRVAGQKSRGPQRRARPKPACDRYAAVPFNPHFRQLAHAFERRRDALSHEPRRSRLACRAASHRLDRNCGPDVEGQPKAIETGAQVCRGGGGADRKLQNAFSLTGSARLFEFPTRWPSETKRRSGSTAVDPYMWWFAGLQFGGWRLQVVSRHNPS